MEREIKRGMDVRAGERQGGGVTAGALCEGQTTHGSVFIHWHLCAGGAGAARALSRITAISTYYPSCLSAARPCGHAPALGRLNGPLWAERERGATGGQSGRGGGGGQEVGPRDAFRALGRSGGQRPDADSLLGSLKAASGTAVRYSCHGLSHQRELFLEPLLIKNFPKE